MRCGPAHDLISTKERSVPVVHNNYFCSSIKSPGYTRAIPVSRHTNVPATVHERGPPGWAVLDDYLVGKARLRNSMDYIQAQIKISPVRIWDPPAGDAVWIPETRGPKSGSESWRQSDEYGCSKRG
jgi:hypothetical protein